MFGLLEKVTKIAVGVSLLPVAAVIDAARMSAIVCDNEEPTSVQTLKAIANNVKDIATGNWDGKSK